VRLANGPNGHVEKIYAFGEKIWPTPKWPFVNFGPQIGHFVNCRFPQSTDRPECKRLTDFHSHHYLFFTTTPIQVATTSNYTSFLSYFFPSPPVILLVLLWRTYTQSIFGPNLNLNLNLVAKK